MNSIRTAIDSQCSFLTRTSHKRRKLHVASRNVSFEHFADYIILLHMRSSQALRLMAMYKYEGIVNASKKSRIDVGMTSSAVTSKAR